MILAAPVMGSNIPLIDSNGFNPVGFIVAEPSPLKALTARPIFKNILSKAGLVFALLALLWTHGPVVALGREPVDVLTSWTFDTNL